MFQLNAMAYPVKPRAVDGDAIRAELLPYLRMPGFEFFEPTDVADYTGIHQVWVRTRLDSMCKRTMIFDYHEPMLSFDDLRIGVSEGPPPAAYVAEIMAMSAFFAGLGDKHSTVLPIRNRPTPPGQPPHPTSPTP